MSDYFHFVPDCKIIIQFALIQMGISKWLMKEQDYFLIRRYYVRLYGIYEYDDFRSCRTGGKVIGEIVVEGRVVVPAELPIKTRLMHVDSDLILGGDGFLVHSKIEIFLKLEFLVSLFLVVFCPFLFEKVDDLSMHDSLR